jgi:anti-anti-sigma factor
MPAMPFRADVSGSGELATIALHGDIDVGAEAGLGNAYAAAAALDAAAILLDFAGTGYINSTGIALLVRLLADARRDHREVRAAGLSPHYAEIFRITRLSDYVRILDTTAGDPAAPGAAGTASGAEAAG